MITRSISNGPLPRPKPGGALVFDIPLRGLVLYPEDAARPFAIVSAIRVLFALISIRRREPHWLRGLILGVLATVIAAALGGGGATGRGVGLGAFGRVATCG